MKKISLAFALFLATMGASFAGTNQCTVVNVKSNLLTGSAVFASGPNRMTVLDKMGRMYTVEYYVLGNGDYYGFFNIPGGGSIYFQSWSGRVSGADDASQAFLVQNPEILDQLEAYFASLDPQS